MKLRLVKADQGNKNLIIDMIDEWNATGEKIIPYAIRKKDVHQYDEYCESLEVKTQDAKEGLVPDLTFFCLDEDKNQIVGAVNIRLLLNDYMLLYGGHIGDGVRPSRRREGIATKMIALALEECRKLGIYRVLMICDKDNEGSARSIMNNGGILEDEPIVEGIVQQRYWIPLQSEKKAKIRYMSVQEIPECVNLIKKSFQTVADEFVFTQDNAPRFTAFATTEERIKYQFENEKRPMFVLVTEDNIVGYYSIAALDEGTCELNNLSVLPEYRHKGYGKQLLESCFEKAGLNGFHKVQIGIVEENQVLRKWYEQNGFIHLGCKKYDFFPFTCGYMERTL